MTVSREDFENCSMDSKLLAMFDELRFIRNEQVNCSRGMVMFQETMGSMNKKINEVVSATNLQNDFLRTLAYKSIDMEARSRRNNLIFRGFIENRGENCAQILFDFMRNRLDIDTSSVYIARAHMLGRYNLNKQYQNRPIIVNFRDFGVTELIMSRVKYLRGTPFSVDYDFPREIQEARGRLWTRFKELKREAPRSDVRIVYPAKLLQDGRVVADEMPDWDECIHTNRLTQMNGLSNIAGLRPKSASVTHGIGDHNPQLTRNQEPTQTNRFSILPHDVPAPDNTAIQKQPSQMEIVNTAHPQASKQTKSVRNENSMVDFVQTTATASQVEPSFALQIAPVVNNKTAPVMPSSDAKSTNSDETHVKSVMCDATNPNCAPAVTDSLSIRGRSRIRSGPVSRSASRSEKRAESARPYRRKYCHKIQADLLEKGENPPPPDVTPDNIVNQVSCT